MYLIMIGVTSAGEGGLRIGVSMIDSRWLVGRDGSSRIGVVVNSDELEVEY